MKDNMGKVIAQIKEAYAKSKAKALPSIVLPEEPKQTAPREIVEEAPVELGHLHFAWHIPELRHPDVPVLDVLAVLLGSGRSSRLYQQVREKQGVVHHVDAWTYSPGNTGLLGMSAIVDADKFVTARDAMLTGFAVGSPTLRNCSPATTPSSVNSASAAYPSMT